MSLDGSFGVAVPVPFHKNFHARKFGEITVFYAVFSSIKFWISISSVWFMLKKNFEELGNKF